MTTPEYIDGEVVRLGTYWNPIYVVLGKEAAIIDGGVLPLYSMVAGTILALAQEIPISYWIITHAHYDHCGLLPYLRDHLPGCQLCASAPASRVLQQTGASAFIEDQNRALFSLNRMSVPNAVRSTKGYQVDRCLEDGDEIDLGRGVRLVLYRTPGHSQCGLAVWLPKQQVLFSSDALGACAEPDEVFPLIFHSHRDYMDSLNRLEALRPHRVMPGHYDHYAGSQARNLFPRAREGVEAFHRSFAECSRRQGIAHALETFTDRHYEKLASGLLTRDIFLKSMNVMWRIIEERK